jgi:hypothetical protein
LENPRWGTTCTIDLRRFSFFKELCGHDWRHSRPIRCIGARLRFAMLVDRRPTLDADTRRALFLLASSVDGCPEALFQAHGFTPKLIQALVRAGHVALATSHVRAGGRVIAVRRLRITDAGRHVI